jgi:cyanophycinase-like exopeptidase
MKRILLGLTFALFCSVNAQNYTSYFTGNATDLVAQPTGGVCLMGGATENDNAMRWFLNQSGGGDILILRASGSNGYNDYFYSQLGVTVNSVESIVCHNVNSATEAYIQQKIQQAEAIWFAGGDQWNYVSYWRNTAIDSLINVAIADRNIVIGGTSAGLAILGKYYFPARFGSVTSTTALADPYDYTVEVDSAPFLKVPLMEDVITDTHYDYYNRRGRHITFLARMLTDWGKNVRGIACEEYTAVCVDTSGIGHVYGDSPNSDDNAYFLRINCEIPGNAPEVCVNNLPLQWDQNGDAIRVYAVKGTQNGANTFDLNDWISGSGGTWEAWSVYNNSVLVAASVAPTCSANAVVDAKAATGLSVSPNPCTTGRVVVATEDFPMENLVVLNAMGQTVKEFNDLNGVPVANIDLADLGKGFYYLKAQADGKWRVATLVVE